MEILALLLVFPLVWPFVGKVIWPHEITIGELALNIAVVVLAVMALWYGGRYAQTADTEILNGQVTSKERDRVSCEHSYQCNCRQVCSGTGSSRSCSQVCDTCYEHSHDYDWMLRTSVGSVGIDRVDRQGLREPPRFTQAAVGDPVARANTYTNYIKGAPNSLFSAIAEQTAFQRFKDQVPEYPQRVYNYHYVDRVLAQGVDIPGLREWSSELALRLRMIGPAKQANVVVLITANADAQYADAVRVKWLGGKKNDVVVVIGAPQYPQIAWVRILSWTKNELFKVELRDELLNSKALDRATTLEIVDKHVRTSFERRPMADFQYLEAEIKPPGWLIATAAAASIVGSLVLTLVFVNNSHRSYSTSSGLPWRSASRGGYAVHSGGRRRGIASKTAGILSNPLGKLFGRRRR